MSAGPSLLAELKRRNVLRAGVLYIGATWALAQGLAQLLPLFGDYAWIARWFVLAAALGFPFWIAFAWFYEFTPQGLKRESEIPQDDSTAHSTGRTLDRAIIAVLAIAVVLLTTDLVNRHHQAVDAAPGAMKSIAVLPLLNESGDPSQDYFSDGLSEELISALGQVRELKVIGRNSSFQFRGAQQDDTAGIGAKLGVATLLEGTVRKQGDTVRIVASLVNAADGSQLWSQTYERQLKDVFAVQAEIATSVATALEGTLLGRAIEITDRPPGGNIAAYDALLQGRYYAERRNRVDYFKAVRSYRQAVTLDPDYALAYARMAIAEQWFLDWGIESASERAPVRALAREHARMAVALDPGLAVAVGALGVVQAWSNLDTRSADATLQKAVSLDPNNPETLYQLADVTATLGRLDEAVAMMRRVLALEPLNASFHFYTGQFLLAQGRLDEAESELRRAIDLQPAASGYRSYLAMVYIKRGQAGPALATAEAEVPGYNRRTVLAEVHAMRGELAMADAQVREMIRLDGDVSPTNLAQYYAYRGDADQAFAWLEHGFEIGDPGVTTIYEDPFIPAALEGDRRFAAFCTKVGLPTPAEAAARRAASGVQTDKVAAR
jgi:TolB-like protein/Tfp pilus assembly protein PilF